MQRYFRKKPESPSTDRNTFAVKCVSPHNTVKFPWIPCCSISSTNKLGRGPQAPTALRYSPTALALLCVSAYSLHLGGFDLIDQPCRLETLQTLLQLRVGRLQSVSLRSIRLRLRSKNQADPRLHKEIRRVNNCSLFDSDCMEDLAVKCKKSI